MGVVKWVCHLSHPILTLSMLEVHDQCPFHEVVPYEDTPLVNGAVDRGM